jgi:hypothetical protein
VIDALVYYNSGTGYTRENSKMFTATIDKDRKTILELELPEGLSQIRVDMGNNACTISVLECVDSEDSKQSLDLSTNGIGGADGYYIFLTNNPQICIDLTNQPVKKIRLVIEIDFIHKKVKKWLSDYLDNRNDEKNMFATIEKLNKDYLQEVLNSNIHLEKAKELGVQIIELEKELGAHIRKLDVQIEGLDAHIEGLDAHIEILSEKYHQEIANIVAMQNSTSWKVTEPLRRVMGIVKRN